MKEEIKAFLNNETYILAYRSNYDSAREVNQMLIDYVKGLQSQLKAKEEAEKEFIKYLEEKIEHNTPRARWKHYNEDGFNDYDLENGDYIEAQPVNITLKEVIEKYNEILSKGENK